MAAGVELSRLATAASQNKGLIYINQRVLGDGPRWYYWNGSSQYGTYPMCKTKSY